MNAAASPEALVEHLFRHEAGRLTATLVRVLGPNQWELAEDIVQTTLLTALTQWTYGAVPDNPAAWLTQVAKRRAIDMLRKRATVARHEQELVAIWQLKAREQQLEAHFEREFADDVLRLMFSCCTQALSTRAQIIIILKTLCGFSVSEIAAALLATPSAVERQLSRAKATIRRQGLFAIQHDEEVAARLPVVQHTIYLLFNEGYHGACAQSIREELCGEALRLGAMLTQHAHTAHHASSHALMALLCLHAARLPARRDSSGALVTLADHDRALWVGELVEQGFAHLARSAQGRILTSFHLEAAIAATHASATSWETTDWAAIVAHYDALVAFEDTAIVRLNRAIALAQRDGPHAGLAALDTLDAGALKAYPFLPAARASCFEALGQREAATSAWRQAVELARNDDERVFFLSKIKAL